MQFYQHEYEQNLESTGEKPLHVTKWRLAKMIGHGSFGEVFEGFDPVNGKKIAVKKVPKAKFADNNGKQ